MFQVRFRDTVTKEPTIWAMILLSTHSGVKILSWSEPVYQIVTCTSGKCWPWPRADLLLLCFWVQWSVGMFQWADLVLLPIRFPLVFIYRLQSLLCCILVFDGQSDCDCVFSYFPTFIGCVWSTSSYYCKTS